MHAGWAIRQGRRGRVIALCVKKMTKYEELSVTNSHQQVEILWIRIRDQDSKGSLMGGVYSRSIDKEEHWS